VAARSLPPIARARGLDATPNATIVERDGISPTIVRLRVRPDEGVPTFRPGQYFALGIGLHGRPLQRPYSTASATSETDALEFLIRLVPHGELTPRLWPLGAGARVRIGRPKGLFTTDPSDPRRLLFVATGTGIAPLLAMLEDRLARTPDGPAGWRPIVVHGTARVDDLAYRSRLEALDRSGRIRYLPAVSRPGDPHNHGWSGATGRLDALLPTVIADLSVDPGETIAFVCGNPGMTDAVAAALVASGLAADAVRSEAYWVAPAPAA
jgi:ferredoxin/flavodoxin---NADP+ reductase